MVSLANALNYWVWAHYRIRGEYPLGSVIVFAALMDFCMVLIFFTEVCQ